MTATASKAKSRKPAKRRKSPTVSAEWRKILQLIPGYDCFRDARGYWFDEKAADLVVDFFHECLTHTDGELAGQPFILEPWQQAIVGCLFGWKVNGSEVKRRYKEGFIFVPRGNGKTPLGAGICNYVLFCDGEWGAQVYSAAADREQAALLYTHARGQVENEPSLASKAKIYGGAGQRSIVCLPTKGTYRIISADAKGKHGQNPSLVIMDELHEQPNRQLYDVLSSGFVKPNRKNPLFLSITTSDFDRVSICNERYDYACSIRDGNSKNARFLPVIYEAKKDADCFDEEVWAKANPNLGVSVSLEALREKFQEAREVPSLLNLYKRLYLNIRTTTDMKWLDMERWDACDPGVDPLEWRKRKLREHLKHRAFGGLDLGSVSDLTSFVLIFPLGDDEFDIIPFIWIPRDTAQVRSRRDHVDYDVWLRDGLAIGTNGDSTDFDQVQSDIVKLAGDYGLPEIALDRAFQGDQLMTNLDGHGIGCVPTGQGWVSMAAPMKRFEWLVQRGKLHHGNNPILRWAASNMAVDIKGVEQISPSKQKSADKIDPIVAGLMALIGAMAEGPTFNPQAFMI